MNHNRQPSIANLQKKNNTQHTASQETIQKYYIYKIQNYAKGAEREYTKKLRLHQSKSRPTASISLCAFINRSVCVFAFAFCVNFIASLQRIKVKLSSSCVLFGSCLMQRLYLIFDVVVVTKGYAIQMRANGFSFTTDGNCDWKDANWQTRSEHVKMDTCIC